MFGYAALPFSSADAWGGCIGILDEWLIRCLTPNERYNLPEIIEAYIERS